MSDERFAGRVVVVTGAGRGLGREIARAFVREGARVVLAARTREPLEAVAREIEETGGEEALVVPADVTDPASVQALRDTALATCGHVDVLVANAGIAGPTAPLWEQSPKDWEATFRVNVGGVFLCCRALVAPLADRRGSAVVIGSMSAKRPLRGRAPYAASKAALFGLVRALAADAGPLGVRVNLISPGPVLGERLDGVIARQAQARGLSEEQVHRELAAASPLERFVEPSDVAQAALFLASEQARSITGEDLNVTAGTVTYG